ncbi:cation:proton antiporter [uncultured Friedmanniella sp.]|uniref:cation:proton antiporter domain-containing protein n=1 Tax=uncultured Friedmanniella sp. TaxID=335381 RepID=UPI0035CB6EA2
MHTALTLVLIVAAVLVVTAAAERIRFSAPLLLMLVGIGASFVPFIHEPQLTSELVLVGFLPPLLYAASIRSSVIDFRANLVSIGFLSVLLVVLTALGIGLLTWVMLPVSFPVAFALGAVVAPPDAVAATSIARRIGLPRRVVTLLEGESLLNDATAITCLRVAIAAIAGAFSVGDVVLGFAVAALGGAAVGVAVAFVAVRIRRRVRNVVFDTAISLLLPFVAYIPAEELGFGDAHGSGVIAVVVAGLLLGHKSPVIQSGQSRLAERVNWATIQFILENTVFLLIGLQAHSLVLGLRDDPTLSGLRIGLFCAAVLVGVVVLRLLFVALGRAVLRRGNEDRAPLAWGESLVVGWAGLRGVVTLAAAFLIPEQEVPHREVLVFAALVVTAGTLLGQGLTLPPLVRALRLRGPDARSDALQAATVLQTASNAGLAALDQMTGPDDLPDTVSLVRDRVASRPNSLWEQLGTGRGNEAPAEQYRRLRLATMQVERDEVLKIRSSGTVDHDVIEQVLAAYDIEESMLTIATERADQLSAVETVATPIDPSGSCAHLELAPADVRPTSETCEDCVREGTHPVHLRRCLSCGNIGCCDSSVGRHAERHHRQSHHPVMRSHEPGESWRWCYVDERLG